MDFGESPKTLCGFMSPAAQTHLLFDTLGVSVRLAAPEFVKLGQESPGLLTFQGFWESSHPSLKEQRNLVDITITSRIGRTRPRDELGKR